MPDVADEALLEAIGKLRNGDRYPTDKLVAAHLETDEDKLIVDLRKLESAGKIEIKYREPAPTMGQGGTLIRTKEGLVNNQYWYQRPLVRLKE